MQAHYVYFKYGDTSGKLRLKCLCRLIIEKHRNWVVSEHHIAAMQAWIK
jgi:hypothetical protein